VLPNVLLRHQIKKEIEMEEQIEFILRLFNYPDITKEFATLKDSTVSTWLAMQFLIHSCFREHLMIWHIFRSLLSLPLLPQFRNVFLISRHEGLTFVFLIFIDY